MAKVNLAVPSIGSYLMKRIGWPRTTRARNTCSTLYRVVPNETTLRLSYMADSTTLAVPSIGSYLMKHALRGCQSCGQASCSTLNRVVPNETTRLILPGPLYQRSCSTLYRVVPNETSGAGSRYPDRIGL